MKNSLAEYLYRTSQRFPHKRCIKAEDKHLSFYELIYESYKLFKKIIEYNIFKKPILVFLPKEVDAITAFSSILFSGNFYAPIDMNSPISRLKTIIKNLEPSLIISKSCYKEKLSSIGMEFHRCIFIDDLESKKPEPNIENVFKELKKVTDKVIDTDPCYIMHTSGSTGAPKGVVIPHRAVIDYIDWAIECFNISDNEIIGNQAPLYFDNSTLDIYLCWATGAELNLIPDNVFLFPKKLIDHLNKEKINFVFFVPTVLINVSKLRFLKENCLPHLKKVLFAGEVMPAKHLTVWQRNLENCVFANLYGPTEIAVDCTYFFVEKIFDDDESIPIGKSCKNTNVIILNEKNQTVGLNELGELCVRGSSLALGYWKNNEKTAEVFVQNPLNSSYPEKIYRTGDMVKLNNRGEIIYVGRIDNQIKHYGHRIELGEIENSYMSVPGIFLCCAIYDKKKQKIILFYESEEKLDAKLLKIEGLKSLPKYMIPIEFIWSKGLPLNQNGKVDRFKLKMMLPC